MRDMHTYHYDNIKKEKKMNRLSVASLRFMSTLLLVLCLAALTLAEPQTNTNRNGSVKGQMKQSGKEVGKAGTSLGSNVKHGRVVRGGKHFGKHVGRAGKHFGKGSSR